MKFSELRDERGHLVVAECQKEIPFDINRIFYIYSTQEGVVRGMHANRNSKLIRINLKGSCKIYCNDGVNEDHVVLDKPH